MAKYRFMRDIQVLTLRPVGRVELDGHSQCKLSSDPCLYFKVILSLSPYYAPLKDDNKLQSK